MTTPVFQRRANVFALATLCCVLWGSSFPAIKIGFARLAIAASDLAGQMLFAGWRFALAGLILLAWAALLKKPILSLSGRQWRQVALLGLTQTTLQYVFFYVGLAHAEGSKSSILNATSVFFSVILAHFLYADDRLSGRKALGCLIGFLGVVVVNFGASAGAGGLHFTLLGEGFIVIAAFVISAASIYGKGVSRGLDPVIMTGWQLFLGGLGLTAIGMVGGGHIQSFDAVSGALLVYLSLLSAVAFGVWSLLLRHNPVGLVAPFNFLIPVFGVSLSGVFLGESILRPANLAALLLVCAGIWLVTRTAVRPPPRTTETLAP